MGFRIQGCACSRTPPLCGFQLYDLGFRVKGQSLGLKLFRRVRVWGLKQVERTRRNRTFTDKRTRRKKEKEKEKEKKDSRHEKNTARKEQQNLYRTGIFFF